MTASVTAFEYDIAVDRASTRGKTAWLARLVTSEAMASRDQQVATVVEGLALGTLASGVSAISAAKLDFELAINRAFDGWSLASDFPSLPKELGPNYVWLGIRKSARRRGCYLAWKDGQWFTPYVAVEGWTLEDCVDAFCGSGPGLSSWIELAEAFLSRLGENKIRRF